MGIGLRYVTIGLLVGVAVIGLYRLGAGIAPNPTLPLVCAVAAPLLGLAVRRFVFGRLTGRFVAVRADGVVIGTWPTPQVVPWHLFDRIIDERGVLKIVQKQHPAPYALEDIFSSESEEDEFAKIATDRRNAWRSQNRQQPRTS